MNGKQNDPDTLIALVFRIVDAPHRTLAVMALALLAFGAAIVAQLPMPDLARTGILWGSGGACTAGLCWLRRLAPAERGKHRYRRRHRGGS